MLGACFDCYWSEPFEAVIMILRAGADVTVAYVVVMACLYFGVQIADHSPDSRELVPKLCLKELVSNVNQHMDQHWLMTTREWVISLDSRKKRQTKTEGCRQVEVEGDGNENVPLYYDITDKFQIQFGREEFFLVTGLRFGVENLGDYNNNKLPIPFRRRCFRHLVLLGVEAKRRIPDWMLRLANDRVGWDNYPWGSFVWPTLYSQLKNANVKRWPKLYASQPANEIDKKAYSIFGYTWAFKGNLPAARLTPDETEARSNWWISSRAYFDGGIGQTERLPRHLNRQNMYEVPSELYRQIEEQKRAIEEQKRGGPSSFQTHPNSSSFFNISTPTNWQTPMPLQPGPSNWQSQMPAQSATPYWQPAFPSHPSGYNWQSPIPSHMGNPNLQPPIERDHDAAGLFNQNILNRGKREQRPSFYKRTPYTEQPPATILPKQRGNKNKNNIMKANLSPLNLGNAFGDENEGSDDVIFLGGEFTGNYLVYENVDPHKVKRDDYVTLQEFLNDPKQIYLDCYIKGYLVPVFLLIRVGENHWVTSVIDLPNAHVYAFDSLPNEGRRNLLWNQIQRWTPVVNNILQGRERSAIVNGDP
ncbi:phospholipase-like protein [Tanacetum coccineum]